MMPEQAVRVMIADDHARVRNGLAACVKAHRRLRLVGEASNGLESISECDRTAPDLILMDIVMPLMDGIQAAARIHEKHPSVKILLLAAIEDDEIRQMGLEAGACDYIYKGVSASELMQAIWAALGICA
jgi:NarL family two-component system response regulator LiaR